MNKNIFTIIVLILIFLGSCIKTNQDNTKETNLTDKKDTIIIPPPTINEIIENGIPEDTTNFSDGISYETDNYSVIEDVVNPGQAISHILSEYNISNSDIYKLDQVSKDIFDLNKIESTKKYTVICSKDSNKIRGK